MGKGGRPLLEKGPPSLPQTPSHPPRRLLTGGEAARQEFRWIWGGENASATESAQREAFGWVLGRGNKGSHVVLKRAVRADAPRLCR